MIHNFLLLYAAVFLKSALQQTAYASCLPLTIGKPWSKLSILNLHAL
jgi:hypothetical protein